MRSAGQPKRWTRTTRETSLVPMNLAGLGVQEIPIFSCPAIKSRDLLRPHPRPSPSSQPAAVPLVAAGAPSFLAFFFPLPLCAPRVARSNALSRVAPRPLPADLLLARPCQIFPRAPPPRWRARRSVLRLRMRTPRSMALERPASTGTRLALAATSRRKRCRMPCRPSRTRRRCARTASTRSRSTEPPSPSRATKTCSGARRWTARAELSARKQRGGQTGLTHERPWVGLAWAGWRGDTAGSTASGRRSATLPTSPWRPR